MKTDYALSVPPEWLQYSRLFAALGDPERQRILLGFEPGESLNASQIAAASALSRTTVSHHLRLLCEAGVLARTRQGREIHYRLQARALIAQLRAVIDYLEPHP